MASFSGFPACYLVVLAEPQVAFGDMAADSESRTNFAPFRAEAATKAITVSAVELAWSGVDQLVKLLPSICRLEQTL